MNYAGLNVLIVGLGVSGMAAADLLHSLKANVYVYDDKGSYDKYPVINNMDHIQLCVVSPGIALNHKILKECRTRRIHIISELELGTSIMQNDIIAITGTNGKTTTTMLVTELLREAGFNAIAMGNIGDPVSHFALSMKDADIAVVEVSSFQLESTNNFKPNIAAIINIAPDHLDRHFDYEDYISCKLLLFKDMDVEDRAIINYDYEMLREFALSIKTPVTFFSTHYKVKDCYIDNGNIYCNGYICDVDDLAMQEPHNLENVLCALSIVNSYKIPSEQLRNVLMRFKPLEYRMSDRGVKEGKRYINDSKGTNIHSTIAACKAVNGSTALILGGSDKGEDYTELFDNLPDNIKYVLVSGENAPAIINAALSCGYNMISECSTLEDCVNNSKKLNVINVLFSPASASFDRYINYADRGRAFDSCI